MRLAIVKRIPGPQASCLPLAGWNSGFWTLLFTFTLTIRVCGQEIGAGGIGAINHSMAGVCVAAPMDGAGAMYWNPATLGRLQKSEFQMGVGRIAPTWYGDEVAGYSVLIPVVAILWLCSLDNDDPWKASNNTNNPHQDAFYTPNKTSSSKTRLPFVRVPCFSFTRAVRNTPFAWGISLTESGARKTRLLTDAGSPDEIIGEEMYIIRNFELTPTISWNCNKNCSIGLSPVFSLDEMPNASLPVLPGKTVWNTERSRFGGGVQLGMYWKSHRKLDFGWSVRSPQWIGSQSYRWSDTSNSELHERKYHFSQDSATRICLGTSYTGWKRILPAADFRYYNYSHVSALYDLPKEIDSFANSGSSRHVFSYSVGLRYYVIPDLESLIFRMGYQYTFSPVSQDRLLYNTTLPIQPGHSLHLGLSLVLGERVDFAMSYSKSFGDGKTTVASAVGPVMLENNHNNGTFWFNVRFLF